MVHQQGVGASVVWGDGQPFFTLKPKLAYAFHRQNTVGAYLTASHWGTHSTEGLEKARVLSIGDGPATGAYAFAPLRPDDFYAVDSSKKMVEIFENTIEQSVDLEEYLTAQLAPFGGVPPGVKEELEARRNVLWATDTRLDVQVKNGWDLTHDDTHGVVDVVYLNQVGHWMISEKGCSLDKFFEHVRTLMKPGSLLVLGESSDFVVRKNREQDRLLVKSGLTAHSAYDWIHEELREGAKKYGIDHPLPKKGDARNHMFHEKTLADDAEGFELVEFVQREFKFDDDPVDAFADRAPMYLGKYDPEKLPFGARLELVQAAADRVRAKHGSDPRMKAPLREQFFYFVFRAI